MTVLQANTLSQAGFSHGFGTRRSTHRDFPKRIHILKQVHGERIVVLSGGRRAEGGGRNDNRYLRFRNLPREPFRFDEGDAMVTDIAGVSIGVRTADCLPLLVGDKVTGYVAAIHCGWRSLAKGLAGKTVSVLAELADSKPANFVAAIGPSIDPCCYEVGSEVLQAFTSSGFNTTRSFQNWGSSLYLNLTAAARTQLVASGIPARSIEDIPGCTMCDHDSFWSYRRGDEEERMISFITARESSQR